jgi:hypothetical protein
MAQARYRRVLSSAGRAVILPAEVAPTATAGPVSAEPVRGLLQNCDGLDKSELPDHA